MTDQRLRDLHEMIAGYPMTVCQFLDRHEPLIHHGERHQNAKSIIGMRGQPHCKLPKRCIYNTCFSNY
jgi:hypothetical protein